MSKDLIRVRILRRDPSSSQLGDEAVAAAPIESGMPVLDEAPILVLPHQDVGPTTNASNSKRNDPEFLKQLLSEEHSPGAFLAGVLDKASAKKEEEEKEKEKEGGSETATATATTTSPSALAAAASQYRATVLPALHKTEAIARQHGLSPGYFAALVMAHYTMTRNEIKELVGWLVSHVAVPGEGGGGGAGATTTASQRSHHFGFEPLRLAECEVAAGKAVMAALGDILGSDGGGATAADAPTARWWNEGDDIFCSNIGGKKQNNNNKVTRVIALLKWLHGVRINVHSDDVNKLTAVFRHACKFNHSCSPNTFWFLTSAVRSAEPENRQKHAEIAERQRAAEAATAGVIMPGLRAALKHIIGNAVHVATRDIAKDEPATFSYIGCGLNMLSPAAQRRHSLGHLGFVCACQRCQAFDAGAKAEMMLRAVICGRCFSSAAAAASRAGQQQPPPPTEFLTMMPLPGGVSAESGGGWRCVRCGHEPQYEDLCESLLHETIHVDHVMKVFFAKTTEQQQQQQSPQQKTAELWSALQRSVRQLSSKHYISAVATASFVSHLAGTLERGALTPQQITAAVVAPSSSSSSSSSPAAVGKEFVSHVMNCMVWYTATMKGSPQHGRFMIALAEIVEQAKKQQQQKSGGGFFLGEDELSSISKMVGSFVQSDAYKRLASFPDMHG